MFINRLQPIPETRAEFKENELPLCQRDLRALAQVHGEEVAEHARFTTQIIRLQGGVNANTVQAVLPEGLHGRLDEDALLRVIGNLATWTAVEPY